MKSCSSCGRKTEDRCTNGHCPHCHQLHCTPGGGTFPGHSVRVYAVQTIMGGKYYVRPGTDGPYNLTVRDHTWSLIRNSQSIPQTRAALAGSVLGWGARAADPAYYNPDGSVIKEAP